jgi:hypothetical protein
MQENNFQQILYMVQHDPAVIAGLLLIGSAAVLFIHIQLKMIRAGYKTSYGFFGKPLSANGWDTPVRYLKVRAKHGWSPWPVYLLGPCVVLGIVVFVLGLLRL